MFVSLLYRSGAVAVAERSGSAVVVAVVVAVAGL